MTPDATPWALRKLVESEVDSEQPSVTWNPETWRSHVPADFDELLADG